MDRLGNGRPIPISKDFYNCREKLEEIEDAVKPLVTISNTLEAMNKTLIKIEQIFGRIVDKTFLCLKWLGVGVFIIVLVAMGFKELEAFSVLLK